MNRNQLVNEIVLNCIKLRVNPTSNQKLVLRLWTDCARNIWNTKIDEEKYYRTFTREYYPINTYTTIDQKASQFKSKDLLSWKPACFSCY
ncbi:helix-turn-helix domain-containing protein [Vibrio sp. TH_r3]|uniref:helix-turn-helix domain-containing protein n=1 Tax=Vibrio sp. TH_r3 TaxID=3082084 RepID=UPI0029529CB9|nr:helix-turn-helix domain-containing protein [Vibrio sp. TH_r3]MDV7106025.1 helix-turn-helix domain-containing protein [Vibrio sp. TH_r3]